MLLNQTRISEIFTKIKQLKVAVIGDFAVDFYYEIAQKTGEISLETNKEVFWAKNPKTSLGGAGNVCANLASLGVGNINPFGIVGNDIFGREMKSLLNNIDADIENIIVLNNWNTCTYTKPIDQNIEQNRIDFGTYNSIEDDIFGSLLENLEKQLPKLDLIIINQQFPKPILTEIRIEKLNNLFKKYPNCMAVADLRTNGLAIRNSILKVNVSELAQLLSIDYLDEENSLNCEKNIIKLAEKIDCKILLTRGKAGIMFCDKIKIYHSNTIEINNEIDTVGAGDTVVASFATAYKSSSNIVESLEFANLAASVSIQKLKQTGTASEAEILKLFETN